MSHGNLPYTSVNHVDRIKDTILRSIKELEQTSNAHSKSERLSEFYKDLKELENYPKFKQGGWLDAYDDGSWVQDSSIPTPTTPSYYPAYPDRTLTTRQMGTPKAPMYAAGATVWTKQDTPLWAAGTPTPTSTQANYKNSRAISPESAIPYPEVTYPKSARYFTQAPVMQGYNPYKGPMRLHAPDTTRMEQGGRVTSDYKKRAGIPYAISPGISDAGMYVGPTTQRGITFGNGGDVPPYITSDPKKFAERNNALRDSSLAYNLSRRNELIFVEDPFDPRLPKYQEEMNILAKQLNLKPYKYKQGWDKEEMAEFSASNPDAEYYLQSDEPYIGLFKKPTQKVIFNPEVTKMPMRGMPSINREEAVPQKVTVPKTNLLPPQYMDTRGEWSSTPQVPPGYTPEQLLKMGYRAPQKKANGGWLDSYEEGGETTSSLINQTLNEARPQASTTSSNVPFVAQALNAAFNQNQDYLKLSEEAFQQKYSKGKHKYKYDTDPAYKAEVDRHVKAVEKSGAPIVKKRVEVNPNMMYMVPSRGYTPETAQALVDANLETIGTVLPIPGLETVGAVPSVFKGINKALTKEAQGIIAGSLLQRQVKNTNPFKIKAPEIIRVDPINRSTVNIKNDIYNQLGEENYNKLLQELYQQNKSVYDNPLVEFKSIRPTSFYPNITNVSDEQALLFKEKFCLPGSACAKSANSVANKLYTDVTGLPFDVNANAHNAWHMEDQMMRHGAKDVTSESLKVGDRILMGNAVDQSTFVPGYTADPSIRHAGTYAGIRIVDGKAVPVLLESGSDNPMYLNPISDTFTGPGTAKKAFRPQQFIDDTFGESLADKNIRYSFRDKPSVATYSSKNPEVQNILSAAESHRESIKKTYDITNDEFDELLNSLIGIGAQETKLNATLPSSKLSKAKIVLQNKLAEKGLTEPIKKGINVVKKGLSALEKTPKNNLPSYPGAAKIEMETAILAEKEGVSFEDALVKVKANYKPKPKHTLLTTTPSKGIFRQKFQPESARLAGYNSDLLSKNSVENALSQMSENYNKVKQMYPNATPRQLIDLTTLMWNSPRKATNKELVDFYLFGKNNFNPDRFKFDYIDKVNNFRNQLIDLQLRGTDPHNEFFRTNNSSLGPYPEIQYKEGGWLDNL